MPRGGKRPAGDKHAIPEGESESFGDYVEEDPGFLYVIGPKRRNGPFKVGYGSDVAMRLSHIQSGSSVEYHVLGEAEFAELSDSRRAEKRAHDSLQDYAVRGEWFKAKLNVVLMAILEQGADRRNVAKLMLKKLNESNCEDHGVSKVDIFRLREVAHGGPQKNRRS